MSPAGIRGRMNVCLAMRLYGCLRSMNAFHHGSRAMHATASSIGQAFADEVFRVFRARHPDTKILAVNANDAVQFMIDRTDMTALAA